MHALFCYGGGCGRFLGDDHAAIPLALTVLYRTHPTERPFDAPVVVPADAVVDRDEHLVAGTLLPMPGIDGLRPHTSEEPLRGGVVRGTAFGARRPRRAVAVHERQPSGLPAAASAVGMHQGPRSLRQRFHGLDEHPVGEPGVGTGTGRVCDDPAIVAADRRREARPSRPRP